MTKKNGHHVSPPSPPTCPGWIARWNGVTVFVEGFENRWFLAREEARKRLYRVNGGFVSEGEIQMERKA